MKDSRIALISYSQYRLFKEIWKDRTLHKGIKNLHCKEGLGKLFGVVLK